MRTAIIITAAFFCALSSMAQIPKIDSLRNELPKQKADSIKVHDRIRISWYLIDRKDSAQAWKYLLEADSIANKTQNPVLKGIVLEHYGFLYSKQNSKKTVTYYLQAEAILKNYPNSVTGQKSMASLALNTGYEHMKVNDDIGALDYFFDAVKRYEKLDTNHFNLPIVYSNIINSYYNLDKFEQALEYCSKSYDKIMRIGNPPSKMSIATNYARVLWKLGRKQEAAVYFAKGKELAEFYKSDFYLAKYYQIRSVFSHEDGEDAKALGMLNEGLPHILKEGGTEDVASYYNWLGIVNTSLHHFAEANGYFEKAYALAKNDGLLFHLKDVYENRSRLEKAMGNYKAAALSMDSFNIFRDSLLHFENADRIEFLDAKYQAEKKEIQISQLTAEKEVQRLNLQRKTFFNYILFAAAVVISLFSFLLFRNFKQKQKLQQQRISELETEKQLAATESVLKGEEQERTRLAKDLHDGLGGMLSGIKYSLNNMKGNLIMTPENAQAFERSMDMLDSSIKEMRRVAHNMMPEALVKFGLDTALRDFCSDINQTGVLQVSYQSINLGEHHFDQTTAITVYRVVQELVNNIIKHASAKQAIVQLSMTNNRLQVTVEDDGKGFDTAILSRSGGIGWTNIQNRVEFLKGKLDISSAEGKGTSVLIELDI